MGAPAQLKYHYFYRFFTYSVKREAGRQARTSGVKRPLQRPLSPLAGAAAQGAIRSEDSVRRGV